MVLTIPYGKVSYNKCATCLGCCVLLYEESCGFIYYNRCDEAARRGVK